MVAARRCFQLTNAYVYTAEEVLLIERGFSGLSSEDMYRFWGAIKDGEWSDLKGRIKTHYILVQDYTCPYCLQRMQVDHKGMWDAEHIIPRRSHPHFTFEAENLCVSCKDCNGEKSNKAVTKSSVKNKFSRDESDYLIVHPHFDKYSDHIKVVAPAGFYLPRTDKGRALVEVCGLLRFVFQYADYGFASAEVKAQMADLNFQLQESVDSLEQSFVLDCIQELAARAKDAMRKDSLKSLMS
ncbi:HNH endonuclease [Pseudomonas sp. GD04087]|uniref:HNH endonuclease n=1 Tax=unclassified Pseudomonas TaxID=196821 RepID=UPI002447CB37|nr:MULTISPECIES: HNH endonuclease signature motif containing protein [unclassified Pseudomonas]MDH0293098.1 HNH endonuclease [Pseudomonas sp. GD04087]MDH1052283.1 HNH endonuclease [Pseudomonas sp. GD03903]MDH2003333.1 HNH endonuclease [Pseudomonas sp. GD03691]